MLKKITKRLALVPVLFSVLFSAPSYAGFPVVDFTSIAQMIESGVVEAKREAERVYRWKIKEQYDRLRHGVGVDNDNNNAANVVARTTQTTADIHNIKQAARSLPSPRACTSASISKALDDVRCAAEITVRNEGRQEAEDRMDIMPWSVGTKQRRTLSDIHEDVIGRVKEYDEKFADGSAKNYPVRADVFFGSEDMCFEEGSNEYDGMARFIDNVTEPVKPKGIDSRIFPENIDDMTVSAGSEIFGRMSKTAKVSVAKESLRKILQKRTGTNGQCEMALLWKESRDLWGSTEAGKKFLANVNAGTTQVEQVARSMAEMQGFMTYMKFIQFEQSLRMETLSAVLLAEQVE